MDKTYLYMPSVNHLLGNAIQNMTDHFLSNFPKNYFNDIRVTTKLPFAEVRDFKKSITAREKPFLVVHPIVDLNEESDLFPYSIDQWSNPTHIENGFAINLNNMYGFIKANTFNAYVKVRRMKLRIEFHIFLDDKSSQYSLQNYLLGQIKHGLPYTIEKYMMNNIPNNVLSTITKLEGEEWTGKISDNIFSIIKDNSTISMTKVLRGGSGLEEIFTVNKESMTVRYDQSPQLENKQVGKLNYNYSVVETVDIEFSGINRFMLFPKIDANIVIPPENSENDMTLVYTSIYDGAIPDTRNGKKIYLQFKFTLLGPDDNKLKLLELIDSYKLSNLYNTITEFETEGNSLDFLEIVIIKKGEDEIPSTFNNSIVTIDSEYITDLATYEFFMYVDYDFINTYIGNKTKLY